MILLARYALILPAVFVLAVYVPALLDTGFGQRIQKTHLFYSPVIKKFVWRDKLLDPPRQGLEEVHHAQFVQEDQDGNRYTRQEFEKLLPFIYFKNMELWGLLPLELEGRSFDKAAIRADRQVLELKPAQIAGRSPEDEIYPLIESRPGTARLVFPEDRFRLGREMEFVNADFNRSDRELSRAFTKALKEAGFVFPARLAAGKSTILKPFEGGFFLVDRNGAVFHLMRVEGRPWVKKTPLDPELDIRSIKVSENRRKEFHGLVLTGDDRLFLLSHDDYALIPLPLEGYDPDTMDFKLIINPLYRTATYSDDKTIRAVVMNREYRPLERHEHTMPGAEPTSYQRIFSYLAPFRIDLEDPASGYLTLDIKWQGVQSLLAAALALGLFLLIGIKRRYKGPGLLMDGALIALTGLYGLAVVLILPPEA